MDLFCVAHKEIQNLVSSQYFVLARSISEDFSSGGGGEGPNKSFRETDDNYCQSRERDRSRERDDRDEGI